MKKELFEDLSQHYGGCTFRGERYALLESPETDLPVSDTQSGPAIKASDVMDARGYLPVYLIRWNSVDIHKELLPCGYYHYYPTGTPVSVEGMNEETRMDRRTHYWAGQSETIPDAYTKADLRLLAQMALQSAYGFAPSLADITLLEASGDGTYILFRIKGHEYRFSSRRVGDPGGRGVYIGPDTIEKV